MTSITLSLTGDILPLRDLSSVSDAVNQTFRIVKDADFAMGNFEMPLTQGGDPVEKLLNIKAHPDIARGLPALGLNLVTVANNHIVDYGWKGVSQTMDVLRDCGWRVIGAGRDIDEAMRPEIVPVGGKRIGIIAFSCLLPVGMAAGPGKPGISPIRIRTSYEIDPYYQIEEPGEPAVIKVRTSVIEADFEAAVSAVKELRQDCDILIVTIHWGYGSGDGLAEYQLPLAQGLIEAGADIIHGHHVHAVHPVGFYKGKPILFSMGTLVGQQVFLDASPAVKALWAGMSPDGYIATISVPESGPLQIGLVPTILDAECLSTIAEGEDFRRIHTRLAQLSEPYGATIEKDGKVLRAMAATAT